MASAKKNLTTWAMADTSLNPHPTGPTMADGKPLYPAQL